MGDYREALYTRLQESIWQELVSDVPVGVLLAVVLYRRQPVVLAILRLPILSSLASIDVIYYEPRYVNTG